MVPSYSLQYYEEIFGGRTPAFWELVEALETQLGAYACDLSRLLRERDQAGLIRLRHAHRPMVEDLGLTALKELETQIHQALDQGDPSNGLRVLEDQFVLEANTLARCLSEERLPGGRGLR